MVGKFTHLDDRKYVGQLHEYTWKGLHMHMRVSSGVRFMVGEELTRLESDLQIYEHGP